MEFLIQYARERPIRHVPAGEDYRGKVDIPLKRMLYVMSVMTGFIFLRTIYRTAEFLDGFQGTIALTQLLFTIFDGAMITLASTPLTSSRAFSRASHAPRPLPRLLPRLPRPPPMPPAASTHASTTTTTTTTTTSLWPCSPHPCQGCSTKAGGTIVSCT
ncbi:hypothetical protein BGW80DRAFT_1564486 [Lactifluus volemus]|nr:hypothetical protein BGW80DRAFT_1564486 [Lactifluus volemus]